MEGPTSSGGLRNRLTCLTLQEHDDDDDEVLKLFNNIVSIAGLTQLLFKRLRSTKMNGEEKDVVRNGRGAHAGTIPNLTGSN